MKNLRVRLFLKSIFITTAICLCLVGAVSIVRLVYDTSHTYTGPFRSTPDPSIEAAHYEFAGWACVARVIGVLIVGWGHVYVVVALLMFGSENGKEEHETNKGG